jgi:hypothetical protein
MLKQKILIALFLFSIVSFSQEIVNSTPVTLKKQKDIFQIIDKEHNEVDLFVVDDLKMKAIRLGENMQIIDSLTDQKPNKKIYEKMIGNNGTAVKPNLFWTSSDYKKIAMQQFNFSTKTSTIKEYDLPLKNEIILQSFSTSKYFYLLTILKNSNILKFYAFDNVGKLEEKAIDVSSFHFYKSFDNKKLNLFDILKQNLLPFEAPFSMRKIESDTPISLAQSAKKRKCYYNEKEIIITIDNNLHYTQLIIIDLENYTAKEKIIKNPSIPVNGQYDAPNSNSFLIKDKLIQVKTSSDKFILTLKDLEDKLIKEYEVTKDTEIDFKNTDIIQTAGGSSSRVLEKSAQFIRKVNNSNSGISFYNLGDKNLITIGSVSEQQQTTAMAMGGMFGAAGALLASAFSNPTMENFDEYERRKVVKIDCLFDTNLNHIEGEVQPIAFDKIQTFFDKKMNVSLKTLFRLNSFYYLGYYDNDNKNYVIRKFED